MSTLDKILLLLKDGEWHDLKEITQKIALPETKTKIAFDFLNEYNFIQLSEDNKKAKLERPIIEFIEGIQQLEKEETANQ